MLGDTLTNDLHDRNLDPRLRFFTISGDIRAESKEKEL